MVGAGQPLAVTENDWVEVQTPASVFTLIFCWHVVKDGATGIVVTVGLMPLPLFASLSVSSVIKLLPDMEPWLLTLQTLSGKGLFTVTWNLMVRVLFSGKVIPEILTFSPLRICEEVSINCFCSAGVSAMALTEDISVNSFLVDSGSGFFAKASSVFNNNSSFGLAAILSVGNTVFVGSGQVNAPPLVMVEPPTCWTATRAGGLAGVFELAVQSAAVLADAGPWSWIVLVAETVDTRKTGVPAKTVTELPFT